MKLEVVLSSFMNRVRDDPRIGPSHISLFIAILYYYKKQECTIPISVFSKELMQQARISAFATYCKCMKDLKDAGYVRYIPSYNPFLGSLVYLDNKCIYK